MEKYPLATLLEKAGLFFRAEGGYAAPFEQDQEMMIQSHRHSFSGTTSTVLAAYPSGSASSNSVPRDLRNENINTTYEGGIETRPINSTIRIWEKTADR